jgi:Fe-S cluster biosynthesis and repair protein YggX
MELILKLIRKPSYNEPHIKDRKLITQKKLTMVNLHRRSAQRRKLGKMFLNVRRKVSR